VARSKKAKWEILRRPERFGSEVYGLGMTFCAAQVRVRDEYSNNMISR
jgi:hypothetical protein